MLTVTRTSTLGVQRHSSTTKRGSVVVHAGAPKAGVLSTLALSAAVILGTSTILAPPMPAHAEVSELEKRKAERQAILAAAREQALKNKDGLAELRKQKTAEADAEIERRNEERRLAAERLSASIKSQATQEYDKAADVLTNKFAGYAPEY